MQGCINSLAILKIEKRFGWWQDLDQLLHFCIILHYFYYIYVVFENMFRISSVRCGVRWICQVKLNCGNYKFVYNCSRHLVDLRVFNTPIKRTVKSATFKLGNFLTNDS